MKREFTASVYLIDQASVLLIYHPKLLKWLPPGGHIEANETPCEAARREVLEETGLEFEFLLPQALAIDYPNAQHLPHPFICLLEKIPAWKETPAHEHVDFVFVGKPKTLSSFTAPQLICRWFNQEELTALNCEQDIFQETVDIIGAIFAALADH